MRISRLQGLEAKRFTIIVTMNESNDDDGKL